MMLWWAIVSFVVAVIGSGIVRQVAIHYGVVDRPERASHRKKQAHSIPLLGGVAIWLSFVSITAWYSSDLTQGYLLPKHLWGIWLAGLAIMIGGVLDDRFDLRPLHQMFFAILAIALVIISGIGIDYITNPFGGVLDLTSSEWVLAWYRGQPYHLTLWADLFTIAWLMISMYTTKLLDGLDGLVGGVGTIGGIVIGLISLSASVAQPETASLAFIFAGACAGFLLWNFYPAKLYLGEGGALWIGFMLGVLAILSGGKIATALLILGLPLLDVVAVVVRRLKQGKSPFQGDTLHLHFQLQQLGWSQPTITLTYYVITAGFGCSTLLLTGVTKLVVLAILLVLGLGLVSYASIRQARL